MKPFFGGGGARHRSRNGDNDPINVKDFKDIFKDENVKWWNYFFDSSSVGKINDYWAHELKVVEKIGLRTEFKTAYKACQAGYKQERRKRMVSILHLLTALQFVRERDLEIKTTAAAAAVVKAILEFVASTGDSIKNGFDWIQAIDSNKQKGEAFKVAGFGTSLLMLNFILPAADELSEKESDIRTAWSSFMKSSSTDISEKKAVEFVCRFRVTSIEQIQENMTKLVKWISSGGLKDIPLVAQTPQTEPVHQAESDEYVLVKTPICENAAYFLQPLGCLVKRVNNPLVREMAIPSISVDESGLNACPYTVQVL